MTLELEIRRNYELPVAITYASISRGIRETYDKVFEKYCPKVKLSTLTPSMRSQLNYEDMEAVTFEHPNHDCPEAQRDLRATQIDSPVDDFSPAAEDALAPECPHTTDTEVQDPDVLYVGRLLDGLTWLQVFDSRKLAKNLINNIPAGQTFTRNGISGMFTGGGEVSLLFKANGARKEMIDAANAGKFNRQITDLVLLKGEAPTINMGTIIKNAEPGEILNSPKTVTPEEVAEGEVDMWEAGESEFTFNPSIRLDNRYGLHYLKRGDEINIIGSGWPKPNTPPFNHTWRLQTPSEGLSYIRMDEAGNDIVELSGLRA